MSGASQLQQLHACTLIRLAYDLELLLWANESFAGAKGAGAILMSQHDHCSGKRTAAPENHPLISAVALRARSSILSSPPL